ncbi:MAB_1171c family putative transporter [Kitasatospora acidiphila]|uniref:MAB_1171c family putative transporter n=1 Tax=Kitasatospora acidiphila TaxID=2567942 RepID=UPI003C73B328
MSDLGPADLAAYLSAAVFLLLAGQWIAAARTQPDEQAKRYAIGFALCMGGGLVARAPATLTALGRLSGGPYPGALLGDLLKTAAGGLLVLLALALRVRGEPERRLRTRRLIRRHGGAAVTVSVLLVLLLYAAHPAVRGDSLVVHGTGRWLLAGYDAVFGGYAVCCLAVLSTVLARQIRRADAGLLRTGLWLMTGAAVVGVIWSLWTLDDLIPVLLRGRQDNGEDIPSDVLGAICAVFAVSGATVTVWGATRWGARITAPARWLRARRRYRALEPLWSALHTAVPGIALAPRPGRRPPLRTAEFALYRRIIEIRDGQLALRPYLPPQLPEWLAAVEPGGEPDGAVLEAAALAAALEARRAGRPGGEPAGPGWVPQPVPGTVAGEAAWLLQVAAAFAGSRLVAEVRQRARAA